MAATAEQRVGGAAGGGARAALAALRTRLFARPEVRDGAARSHAEAVARAGLMVWAPVLLSLGIGMWFALPFEPGPVVYAALLAGCALLASAAVALPRRMAHRAQLADALRVGLAGGAIVLTGGLACGVRTAMVAAPVLEFRYYGTIEGRVVDVDRSARDRMRLLLDGVRLTDTVPERTPRYVRISLTEPQPPPEPGALVRVTGHLSPPPGPAEPGAFDFRRAAWFESLGGVGYTRKQVEVIAPPPPSGRFSAAALRLRLGAWMSAGIGGQEGAVASALMTGDRSGIVEATNQIMRDSNLYHIVSISGLHMSMLAGFVYSALRLMLAALQAWPVAGARLAGRGVHKIAAGAALGVSAAYLWLSGGGVPTERAFVTVAVMLAAILLERQALSLRTVALAALAILLAAPDALVTPGFQMSFAATVALILFFPVWARHAAGLPLVLRAPAMLILSSLIASIATSPLAAAHFQRASHYGLLANLLAVPVMGALVMPAGVVALLLAPLGLAAPALWLMGLGTRWMLWVAETIAGWGGSVTEVMAPQPVVLPLMGLGATVAVLAWRPRPGPLRAAVIAAALAALGAAGVGWWRTDRPALLIADDASAVGLLTPVGRALSKPAGAFIAENWLRRDGDLASAEEAAERPGWEGPRGSRSAQVGGTTLVHLSGKGAADRLSAACRPGSVVILATTLPVEATPRGWADTLPCRLFEPRGMRRGGAMGARVTAAGTLRWQSAAELSGRRLWSDRWVRRDWFGGAGAGGAAGQRAAPKSAAAP